MKILVVGAGAVGGYFGGRLAMAGIDVAFLVREKRKAFLQERGLRVKSIEGDFDIRLPKMETLATPPLKEKYDLIIFTVKNPNLQELLPEINKFADERTLVLPLENGISVCDTLKSSFKESLILGGVCHILSELSPEGEIVHKGQKPAIIFGDRGKVIEVDRLLQIYRLLQKSGIKTVLSYNIEWEQWKKFIFITATSSLGAITRSPVGIYRQGATRNILEDTVAELIELARRSIQDVPEDAFDLILKWIDGMPEYGTTSTQRDILNQKPSEIDFFLGESIRRAHRLDYDLPICTTLYSLLIPQLVEPKL